MHLLTLLTFGLGGSLPAAAQDATDTSGFDAHGFNLAAFDGDPRDGLRIERPGRFTAGEFWAGGLFEYARDPLVQYTLYEGQADPEVTEILSDLYAINASGGYAILDTLRLDLSLPLYLSTTGPDQGPQGVGLGDLRLGAMYSIIRPEEGDVGGLGLGVFPYVDLPTGNDSRFIGQPGFAGGLKAAVTYELEKLTLGADLGAQLNPKITLDNLTNSSRLVANLGVGYLINEKTGVNGELSFAPPFRKNEEKGSDTPIEATLSVRGRSESGGFWTVGAASALSEGAGAATFRVFVGGGFGKIENKPKDMDMDGIVDKLDACPEQPETVNSWKDTDGCPDSLGTLNVSVSFEGENWPDADVSVTGPDSAVQKMKSAAQPNSIANIQPETSWSATATAPPCLSGMGNATVGEGPTDLKIELQRTAPATLHFIVTDEANKPVSGVLAQIHSDHTECVVRGRVPLGQDGKADQEVGAGKFHVTLTQNDFLPYETDVEVPSGGEQTITVKLQTGKVKVSEQSIIILEMVYFETAKDIIKPESFPLLDQVAMVFKTHPEIKKVEISGHTDSQGKDAYNLDLSDRRAKSVRAYLVSKGVEANRMDAIGYGETKPIDSNNTANGRAKNRRVEFNILVKEDPK